ncbi:MAG: hypothetical protein V7707_07440, partial [Motiliproteus sp.]
MKSFKMKYIHVQAIGNALLGICPERRFSHYLQKSTPVSASALTAFFKVVVAFTDSMLPDR